MPWPRLFRRPALKPLAWPFAWGLLLALGQAPFHLWPLTLGALLLLFAQGQTRLALAAPGRAAFGQGAAWFGAAGAGYFMLALSWIVEPFLVDIALYGWMAPFALPLMAGGLALFWAAAGALAVLAAAGQTRLLPLALALTLWLAEGARGLLFTGFPWAELGQIWIGTPLDQSAAYIGGFGLTGLTFLAAGLTLSGPGRLARVLGPLSAFALGLALWLFGAARLAAPLPDGPGGVLRLVQPHIAQSVKWDPEAAAGHLEKLLRLSALPPTGSAPADLVIWPETAVPYYLDPTLTQYLADFGPGVPLIAGAQTGVQGAPPPPPGAEGEALGPVFNALVVITPDGAITQRYDKRHLVPFGEYIPFGDWAWERFGLAAFAAQTGHAYTPGGARALLDFGPRLGAALPLICYEVIFPRELHRPLAERAGWILQVTNDAWFGRWSGPYQHLDQARLRAIEQGLPLVRVANTGVSAVVDARGRILQSLPLGAEGVLDAALPGALPPPPFARWGQGPVFAALCMLLAVLTLYARLARRLRLDGRGRGA